MIVEFIGSTGSGKTTLISNVQRRLAGTVRVTTSPDLATSLLGFKNVTNLTLQNLEQELLSFPFLVGKFYKYHAYLSHTIKLFWRNTGFSMQTIHNLRSLERKVGMYEISKRHGKDQVILVDEGPLLALHMFVSSQNTYTSEEIARFIDLLPLPDLVIYVRTSVDTLIKRALQRPDPPREVDRKDPVQMDSYFKNAVAMFDQLTRAESIREKILAVDSLDMAEPGFDQVVERVCQTILDKATFLPQKSHNSQ